MLAIVTLLLSLLSLLVAGALALHSFRLTRRLRALEASREIERRHRGLLTLQVERLEDAAAGTRPSADRPLVGFAVKSAGRAFPQ